MISALDYLWSKVAHLSNSEHIFLHPTYSPNSRIPCADFTTFIVDRLRNHDLSSIKLLMRKVIAANPGLGIGPEWIDKSVEEISAIKFDKYCNCSNPDFFLELKALFILGEKEGGNREFWLTDDKPLLFALALSCQNIRWLDSIAELREKANNFILKMREDTPYWESYPLFEITSSVEYPKSMTSEAALIISKLPLLSRLHLLFSTERETASLMQTTTYGMRSLGLNPLESATTLLASGLCELTTDLWLISKSLSRDDIVANLDEQAIHYKKSWNKLQLLEVLNSKIPDLTVDITTREKIVNIKPEFFSDICLLTSYAKTTEENIKLLCFVNGKLS